MRRQPNTLKRTEGDTSVIITWPSNGLAWDSLNAITRNQIRDHLDAAVDLINQWALS